MRVAEEERRTYLVAVFCSFQGLPLVRPAEDCASSRGAEGEDATSAEVEAGDWSIVVKGQGWIESFRTG